MVCLHVDATIQSKSMIEYWLWASKENKSDKTLDKKNNKKNIYSLNQAGWLLPR